jgi:pyridinium-3,5-biscarboxylic acid mononucleotide sulfurtransferase
MLTTEKLDALRNTLREMGSVVVAYSGGVDSSFLLKVAVDVLGPKTLGVTAVSPTYTEEEHDEARRLAGSLGARHIIIATNELHDPGFATNPPDRCYHCKKELCAKLREIADREGIQYVLDGQNADDSSDYRPGARAAREAGMRSPLAEVGLTKSEIRAFSREMGLPTWDKPAAACLASRFPYGEAITMDKLKRVDAAEKVLHTLGFRQVRVRSHGDIARIEVDPPGIVRVAEPGVRDHIVRELKAIGYSYVALDLEGYRMGSMNEPLKAAPA